MIIITCTHAHLEVNHLPYGRAMCVRSRGWTGTVFRHQKDGSCIPVPCPQSIIDYNAFMGRVDRGDQIRGYYNCRTKCRKLYKYIFHFLLDTVITNAYILQKHFSISSPKNILSFHLQLSQQLIGEYCSWHRLGLGSGVVRSALSHHHPYESKVQERTMCTLTTAQAQGGHLLVLPRVWSLVVPHWREDNQLFYDGTHKTRKYLPKCYNGQSLFSGLDYWTGLPDWTTGLTNY